MLTLSSAAFALLIGVTVGHTKMRNVWKQEIVKDWEMVNKSEAFKGWKTEFKKEYSDIVDETYHFNTFVENWQMINDFNSKEEGYTLRLNQFGDLTEEEFKIYVHGHNGSCLQGGRRHWVIPESSLDVNVPTTVDWTNVSGKSYVSAVKNQGQCGSCWAFSTTGSLEGRASIKTGVTDDAVVTLSEQQLVDCSGSYGNKGCQGGLMDDAFKYIKDNGGLCSEKEYPYTGKDGAKCAASTCGTKYDAISGYKDVNGSSFSSLEAAVAEGPVSIAIQANTLAFQFYHSGVFTGNCGTQLDHGVLVVGYGVYNGQKYWKVKNSWGASWGMDGYILICKECGKNGNDGECGLLMEPSYPILQ